jgi:hypothetical protein
MPLGQGDGPWIGSTQFDRVSAPPYNGLIICESS